MSLCSGPIEPARVDQAKCSRKAAIALWNTALGTQAGAAEPQRSSRQCEAAITGNPNDVGAGLSVNGLKKPRSKQSDARTSSQPV